MVLAHPEDEFYFFFDRPYDEEFIFAENVHPVVLFPPTRHVLLYLWWFEISVHRALKRIDADVFISPDNILSLNTKVPTVLVTHDLAYVHFPGFIPWLTRKYFNFFGKRFNRKADKIVAVSECTKSDLVQTFDISPKKISVACNGCSPAFRKLTSAEKEATKQRFAGGKDYVFYVGAVHPRKNVQQLIKAFDAFKTQTKADLKLLIGGRFAWRTGPVTKAYEAAAHQADIEFIGFVSEADLPLLMGACFVFVYPSKFEGFGIPILEAMHSEVPVITSDVSSLPEVAGEAALLINPDDARALTAALLQVYFDEKLREKLVAAGMRQREKFTWERAARVLREAVESLS